jgi:hypothetical protein
MSNMKLPCRNSARIKGPLIEDNINTNRLVSTDMSREKSVHFKKQEGFTECKTGEAWNLNGHCG